MRLALQLYSVRNDLNQDVEATLQSVAQMGFDGVELFGTLPMEADKLKQVLDAHNLQVAGWHLGLEALQPDQLQQTVAHAAVLGIPYLVVPHLDPQHLEHGWLHVAGLLQQAGDALEPYGIKVGYHNSQIDFDPVQDSPWEVVFANTDDNVIMQLDTGNAVRDGADIQVILKHFPGRAQTVHLKPYSHTKGFECVIGQDDIDWLAFLQLCQSTGGTHWLILEVESQTIQPLHDAVTQNVDALRGYLSQLDDM